jgi:hypothetical protein
MEFQIHVSTEQDCVHAVTLYTCGRKQPRSNIDLVTIIFEIFNGFPQSLWDSIMQYVTNTTYQLLLPYTTLHPISFDCIQTKKFKLCSKTNSQYMVREEGDEMIVTEFITKIEYTALNHIAFCTFTVATK